MNNATNSAVQTHTIELTNGTDLISLTTSSDGSPVRAFNTRGEVWTLTPAEASQRIRGLVENGWKPAK